MRRRLLHPVLGLFLCFVILFGLSSCSGQVLSPETVVHEAMAIFFKGEDTLDLSQRIYGYNAATVRQNFEDRLAAIYQGLYPDFTDAQNEALAHAMISAMDSLISYQAGQTESADGNHVIVTQTVATIDITDFQDRYLTVYEAAIEGMGYAFGSSQQVETAFSTYMDTIGLLAEAPDTFHTINSVLEAPMAKQQGQWVFEDFERFWADISNLYLGIIPVSQP